MLRLLFFLCIFSVASGVFAQSPDNRAAGAQADYTYTGAPMPQLKYLLYFDTGMVSANARNSARSTQGAGAGYSANVKAGKQMLNNNDLKNGANLFVMIFNPTCSHCMDETALLEKNSNLFKRSKLALLAAPAMQSYLADFIGYTHVDRYPFIYLGIDSSNFTGNIFLYKSLPQITIYDENQKLLKIFSGEVAIDSLRPYIQ